MKLTAHIKKLKTKLEWWMLYMLIKNEASVQKSYFITCAMSGIQLVSHIW